MTPGLVQRHQDYVLGPNQDGRLASVTAGQSFSTVLELDPDAPFLMRSRAMRVRYSADGRTQTGLNHLLMRWSGPNRDFRSQHVVRQSLYGPYFGQIGNPIPVYPQVFYPRQSSINIELVNDGASTLTNLTFYFRGVKLFNPGSVKAYTYPQDMGLLPFVYPQAKRDNAGVLTPIINDFPVNGGPTRYTFRVKPDADFVFRGGQSGDNFDTHPANEIFIRLRDEDEKPYSNDFVHMDMIWGNSAFGDVFPAGSSSAVAPVGGGPNSPGLLYPEIYIPKNHILYFDVLRNDTYVGAATTVDYPLSFIGQKVFNK
jgi:hypothetical protein